MLSSPPTCSSVKSKEPLLTCVKVRKTFIGVSLVSSSTFDLLLELIKCIITKQHAVFIWSISSSEHLTRDQKALFLLARSYDALRHNS